MSSENKAEKRPGRQDAVYDYGNNGWPRDFDIRIEVAEQREVLQPRNRQARGPQAQLMHTSEYDF